jgi:hypothetical protein
MEKEGRERGLAQARAHERGKAGGFRSEERRHVIRLLQRAAGAPIRCD